MQQMQNKVKSYNQETSELSTISCIIKNGAEIVFSSDVHLAETDFKDKFLGRCFFAIKTLAESGFSGKVSPQLLVSEISKTGSVSDKESSKISEIADLDTSANDYHHFVRQVKFWSLSRAFREKLSSAAKVIDGLSGSESIVDVASSVESSVFDFIPDITKENDLVQIGSFATDHINYIAENPVTSAGLPTGFPRYDKAVGGGYRRGTVNVVGARPKVGKSTFCLNVAANLSKQGIPVLYLDTEMKKETQTVKWVSLHSGVDQNSIETGQFAQKDNMKFAIDQCLTTIKDLPFYHISIAGKKPEEIMAITRRWLSSVVGRDEGGNTNNCLVMLDYLKTMDMSDVGDIQEYQYLGDFITKLHNFAVKYDVPILATVQLNRDGINKEDTSVVSGSDRILWLCSSLAYLKKKTDEDVAAGDSKTNGDRKLVVIETRYGQGMDSTSEYINVISNLERSEMVEGKFNFEILESNDTIEENDDDEDEIDF
jgi:replicative DNA helicase